MTTCEGGLSFSPLPDIHHTYREIPIHREDTFAFYIANIIDLHQWIEKNPDRDHNDIYFMAFALKVNRQKIDEENLVVAVIT